MGKLCNIYGGINKTKERKNITFILLCILRMECFFMLEIYALFLTKLRNKKTSYLVKVESNITVDFEDTF